MMQLLKFISFIVLVSGLLACSHQLSKPIINANVNSNLVEIPDQAAQDFKNAISLINQQKLDEAIVAFELMIQAYPQLSGPYANLGAIYSQMKNWELAVNYLERAKAKNYRNYKILSQLGLAYRHMGEFKKAEEAYVQAINFEPNADFNYLNLGILYDIYMGDLSRAKIQYEKYQSLQSEPDRNVSGWIVDINRRSESAMQVAGDGQ